MAAKSGPTCVAMLALVCGISGSVPQLLAQSAVVFEDSFDAAPVSTAKWRPEDLVAGMRWCGSTPGSPAAPGSWINTSTEACFGLLSFPPHGIAVVESGLLRLSAPFRARAVPYLSTRQPEGVPVFPAVGDFVLTLRVRFDQLAWCGDGVMVIPWDDTRPIGDNASITSSNIVFQLWGDGGGIRLFTCLRGSYEEVVSGVANQDAFHEYVVRYEQGEYRFLVDGQVVFGPVLSSLRPTAMWIGNPIFSYSGCEDWSALSVDFVRVEGAGPTPVRTPSWGELKSTYR